MNGTKYSQLSGKKILGLIHCTVPPGGPENSQSWLPFPSLPFQANRTISSCLHLLHPTIVRASSIALQRRVGGGATTISPEVYENVLVMSFNSVYRRAGVLVDGNLNVLGDVIW
jgi:hypothetical protein